MNTISADVSEKIKSAIKAKLMELGAFVDEELPDYIMVLVCDKRDKAQLEDDLKLFLGASTEKFTSWLDQVISKLEEVSSTSSKDNKKSSKSEAKKRRSKDGDDEEPDSKKGKKRKSSPSGSKEEKRRKQSDKEESSIKRRKISDTEIKKTDVDKVAASSHLSEDEKSVSLDTDQSLKTSATECQESDPVMKAANEKPKVVLMQSDDDDDDEDFLNIKADAEAEALLAAELDDEKLSPSKSPDNINLIEEPIPEVTNKAAEIPEEKPEKQAIPTITFVERSDERPRPLHSRAEAESSPEISTAVVRPSHISLKRDRFENLPRVRQLRQIKIEDVSSALKRPLDPPVEKAPRKRALLSSRVVAPAKTAKMEEEEEEYDPLNPAVGTVASIVRVKPRPKIPVGLQANKTLLLKAVADAHKSVANFTKRPEPIERPTELHTRKFREHIAVTVDTSPLVDTGPADTAKAVNTCGIAEHEHSKKDDIEPYTPEPLSKINARLSTEGTRKGTQFFVTLHGVDKEVFQNDKVIEEELDLDEDMERSPSQDGDEEVFKRKKRVSPIHFSPPRAAVVATQASLPSVANLALDDLVKVKLSSERCRFWPNCRQADKCLYHHPNTPCKQFPNCKFGDKCLFIHPNCKFDASCTRRDCPFTHASPRIAFTAPGTAPVRNTTVCRFFPKCANPGCQYLHPKPCRYGQFCTKKGCTYQHDPKIPTVNQLKWSSAFRA